MCKMFRPVIFGSEQFNGNQYPEHRFPSSLKPLTDSYAAKCLIVQGRVDPVNSLFTTASLKNKPSLQVYIYTAKLI